MIMKRFKKFPDYYFYFLLCSLTPPQEAGNTLLMLKLSCKLANPCRTSGEPTKHPGNFNYLFCHPYIVNP